ncbi:hypothetical protein TESG_07327 [Trichophyton tonsurans CBS 112818]|uniref:Uncharacterized protein n=1 Tax=Trichophyton tonsurans (strain CBS 112818) TaxID=647933 RepID=F2S8V0_TRIT1|nr:hypothetical protein TESG_07327 [Trichophyton tonsurans CBS 112818]
MEKEASMFALALGLSWFGAAGQGGGRSPAVGRKSWSAAAVMMMMMMMMMMAMMVTLARVAVRDDDDAKRKKKKKKKKRRSDGESDEANSRTRDQGLVKVDDEIQRRERQQTSRQDEVEI